MACDSNIPPPTLSDDMQPILWILRLLTITPFSMEKGRVRFSWQSCPMVWSITSFIVMAVYASYVFTIKYSDLFAESRSFSDVIFFLTFLELLHHHFVSPFVHWPEAQGLADYFQSWNDFQAEFQKSTGSPLHFALRSHCWRHFTLTLLVPALLCCVATSLLKPIRAVELLPFISTGMFHAIMPRTWSVFGLAVVRAGDCLQQGFDATVSKRDANALKSFRILWTKLRRLSEAPGTCWGVTTIHYLLYSLVTLLITSFGLMTALQQGSLTARGQTLLCMVVDSLAHAWTVCTAGYSSCYTVGTFLQVIQSSQTKLSMSGFVILDRTLLVAMVGLVVTYLCVLAQFGATVNQLFE